VVVATPTALHTEHLLRAAEARCPLFSEKPISLDLATTVVVLDQLDAIGVPLQVGFQRRFDPGFVEMRRVISEGQLGDLFLIRIACHDRWSGRWRWSPERGPTAWATTTATFDRPRRVLATGLPVAVDEVTFAM